jgi:hypothetical protein
MGRRRQERIATDATYAIAADVMEWALEILETGSHIDLSAPHFGCDDRALKERLRLLRTKLGHAERGAAEIGGAACAVHIDRVEFSGHGPPIPDNKIPDYFWST